MHRQFTVTKTQFAEYEVLLKRLQDELGDTVKKERSRLEIPAPQIIWVGKNTIFRNFMEFPKALRRDPEKVLLYLNKELASAGYIAGERVIFEACFEADGVFCAVDVLEKGADGWTLIE